jgi:hypothetical protein
LSCFVILWDLAMMVERSGSEDEIGGQGQGVDPVRVLIESPYELALDACVVKVSDWMRAGGVETVARLTSLPLQILIVRSLLPV